MPIWQRECATSGVQSKCFVKSALGVALCEILSVNDCHWREFLAVFWLIIVVRSNGMFFINGQNHRNVVSIHSTSLMRFLLWDFKISKTKISSTVFYEAHFLCHEDKQKKKDAWRIKNKRWCQNGIGNSCFFILWKVSIKWM